MTKTQIAKSRKQIKAHMNNIAADRDSLRDTIDELEGLEENCNQALVSLNEADDALSELV